MKSKSKSKSKSKLILISNLMPVIKILRPHQWIKNSFVLAGVFFSQPYANSRLLKSALLTAAAFCLMSSAVYIYNDIIDLAEDRLHPVKKNRPLALKKISLLTAAVILSLLFLSALIIGGRVSPKVMMILMIYGLINISYTHVLKKVVIIDVFMISAGFMLRILAGTTGINIAPSPWLLFCGLSLTLFLGFTKRRAESFLDRSFSRQVSNDYYPVFLDKIISITASCAIIGYALYTISPETIRIHHTQNLIYTVPLVIYGIFRYLYLLHTDKAHKGGEDTARDIFIDSQLFIALCLWICLMFYLLA